MGSVLCNYSLVGPSGNNSEALESRCSPATGCPLPLGCWQPGEPCQVAGWENVKAQIKPRALKSHETAVMRKVTGSGGGLDVLSRQATLSLVRSPLPVVLKNEAAVGGVCIFDFPNPGFRMILRT